MNAPHSWNWLLSRPSVHSSPALPEARPCLPVVEQLDDRVMFSVAADVGGVDGGGGTTEVLIALLRGQLPLVSDELNALKIAGGLSTDHKSSADYIKLSNSFLKLEDVIYKFGDVLIKAAAAKVHLSDITITKPIDKASAKIFEQLNKIDELANTIGGTSGQDLLLPAVQKLEGDTTALVNELLKLAPDPGALSKVEVLNFLKISNGFLKIDQDVIKIGSDLVLEKKVTPGEMKYLEVKLEQILVSSAKLNDPALQKVLIALDTETIGLLKLNDGGGDVIG